MSCAPHLLPVFRFHPDPVASGSVVATVRRCDCCGQERGWLYDGPLYGAEAVAGLALCPWCIADGAAHARWGVEFTDSEGIAGDPPAEVVEEITRRTPGFASWQQERWLACCGEPSAFVMPAGWPEIVRWFPRLEGPLMAHIVHELGISGGGARRRLETLDRDRGPTAMVFRCRTCGTHHAYVDGP